MPGLKREIETARMRFHLALGLQIAGAWLAVWMAGAGAVIVALKATGYHHFCPSLWILYTALPIPLAACWLVRQRQYSPLEVAAWLDLKNGHGGRSIQFAATGGAEPAVTMERRAGLFLAPLGRKLSLPALFLCASLWIPGAAWEPIVSDIPLRHRARQVQERLETVKERDLLSLEEVVALEKQLERALTDAQRSPESAAEAIDGVQQSLDQMILQKAESIRKGLEAAAKAAEEAEKLDGGGRDAEESAKASEALAQALAALPPSAQLPPELRQALDKLMKEGNCSSAQGLCKNLSSFDPKAIQKLAEQLAKCQGQRLQACSKLSSCMVSGEMKKLLEDLGKGEGMGFCPGGENGLAAGSKPGRGGVTRGRGDADLAFGDESPEGRTRFDPKPLSNPSPSLPGVLLGTARIQTEKMPPEEFRSSARSGVVTGAASGEEMASGPASPYRRRVVNAYFSEESK